MMTRALGILVMVALSGFGCGDEGTGEPVTVECDPSASGKPVGCVYGKLVDTSGKPVDGARVSACSGTECIYGTTNASGVYSIQGVAVAPKRMDILGEAKGIITMIWWQDVTEGIQTRLERPVKVYPVSSMEKVALDPGAGGKVLLADGQLELEVEADSLKYPIGTVDKSVGAIEVAIKDLPPFDIAPWAGKESKSRAFVLNPFPVKTTIGAKLRVFGEEDAEVNALYTVYSADTVNGDLEEVGLLRADGSGALVSEPGGQLKNLATIIIVPN